MLDTQYSIETPEGTDLSIDVAGPVVRALAWAIDFLIFLGIFMVFSMVLSFAQETGTGLMLIVLFLLQWFYPVLFEVYGQGRTPGKRVFNIQVIQDDGTPIVWAPSLIRNLLRAVDFLPLFYMIGLISMVLNGKFKRLGDLAAGTLVVHYHKDAEIPQLPKAPPKAPPIPFTLAEQRACLDFAERHSTLSEDRAQELARILQPLVGEEGEGTVKELHKIANGFLGKG